MLNKKWFLYITEFFAGMSVMAVELGASRLLAPYFSSSQIVWTIIIGTIMIAMAGGNILGGRLADKNPDPARLYMRILIAGVWIAAIPLCGKYVIALVSLCLAFVAKGGFLIWASLISCLILFVLPLMLLGTVTPSLARYTVKNIDDSGKIVGELGALNTIGSIIGTFLPTFVTIPSVGTAVTFLIFAGILLIISLIYFISVRKKVLKCTIGAVIAVVVALFGASSGFSFWNSDIIYEGESVYNYLQVKENEYETILATNVLFGVQSVKTKGKGLTGHYYDYALAAPYLAGVQYKKDPSALILGFGSGTYASLCDELFDNLTIEGVEIDEKIVKLSKEYFSLPEDVSVSVFDGRAYLQTGAGKDKTYDLILVDAYQDITIPFQMSTIEFFTLLSRHMTEDGVLVVNLNMHSDKEGSINQYLSDTVATVFDNLYFVNAGGNRLLFAFNESGIIDRFYGAINDIQDRELKDMMKKVKDNLHEYEGGDHIFTDDKAPVELLGIKLIDDMIIEEINEYKSAIKGFSIRELFNMIK